MNITIDDTSPLIGYFNAKGVSPGGWMTNHSNDAAAVPYYFGQSFHDTSGAGDYMSFSFNGSAIYVYGAYRSNHGAYSAIIDGATSGGLLNGFSANAQFQVPIFFTENLNPTRGHTVVLTNRPDLTSPPPNATVLWYLDIDYIIITTVDTEKVWTTQYDDFSPAITFNGFNPISNFGNQYYNSTNHLSKTVGATAFFSFNGTSIQVFGGTNYDHGNYSVVLDGGLNQIYNGYAPNLFQNSTLYLATNLTQTQHTISITNLGGPNGNALDLDWIEVNSTVAPLPSLNSTNTTTGSSSPSSSSTSSSGSSDAGAIAGGVVGGIAGIAIIGFLIWFFWWRKRQRKQPPMNRDPGFTLDAEPYREERLDGGEIAPFPATSYATSNGYPHQGLSNGYPQQSLEGTQMEQRRESMMAPASSGYEPGGSSFLQGIPPPPSSNATSYPDLENSRSPDAGQPLASPQLSNSQASSEQMTNLVSNPNQSAPSSAVASAGHGSKTAGVALPYTSRSPPVPSSPTNHRDSTLSSRMNVAGREVDLGPVSPDWENEEGTVLPPNYDQATEPLPGQRREEEGQV